MIAKKRKPKSNVVTGIYEPYESELCVSFYTKYLYLKAYNQLPNIFLFHIPNEQMAGKSYIMHLKRMGLVSGVADYMVAIRGGGCAFIEFKRSSKCKQSTSQVRFEEDIKKLGIEYHLLWDIEDAINLLLKLNNLSI